MAAMNDVKSKNVLDVVKELYDHSPISKPDIARNLGLTNPSVHNFINELLYKGVVIEEGIAGSNGGRRATLYNINPECGYLIGVNMYHTKARLGTTVYNMKLERLYCEYHYIPAEYSLKSQRAIREEIEKALKVTGIPKSKCFGVGVTIPGLVNYDTGVIWNIPHMPNWNRIALKSYLEDCLEIPVIVDNDANAAALVGKWIQKLPDSGLVALTLLKGVGAGIITNGSVFRGANHAAGEIGHTTINFGGIKCKCGNRGCIDAYIRQCEEKLTCLAEEHFETDISNVDRKDILDFIRDKSPEMQKLTKDLAKFIAITINHVIKSFSPINVVVYCEWMDWNEDLKNYIRESVYAQNSWLNRDKMQIRFKLPDQVFLYAGASQVLEFIFNESRKNYFLQT